MARLHQIFGCPCAFAKPADLEFLREKVLHSAEQQTVTSLEGQLMNSRAPDICTYVQASPLIAAT